MKKFLLISGLTLVLFSCQEQAPSESSEIPQEEVAATTGKEAVKEAPSEKQAQETETYSSPLAGLESMAIEEAMENDGFKSRLAIEMGEVQSVLLASDAEFEKDGQYLMAEGEITKEGKPFLVVLVADLKNDALSSAQYDSESDKITTFAEKEAVEMPVPLQRWVDDWR